MPVEITDLRAGYGDLVVLRGLRLSVGDGEVKALLGRNGVGKSTLLLSVAGLLAGTRGTVRIAGVDSRGLSPEKVAHLGLCMMPQGHRIFGSLTVGENLQLAREATKSRGWPLDRVYAHLPVLGDRHEQIARTLSGGEQQMLMLARMLAAAGSVCVLDEPTEGLAPSIVARIAQIVLELRKENRAILLIEQQMNFALKLADTVAVMARGKIVFEGSPSEFSNDDSVKAEYLNL